MSLPPGSRVDRYEVVELLGSGGMGEVYRARDPKLARLVALKILRVDRGLAADPAALLLREARAVAALSHPNVLTVYDVGDVTEPEALRGLSYISMELVVGRSLRAYIGDATVPMRRRIDWLRDIATALGAAHAAGIVHRDVKPENIMVRVDGVVKVLDFGIARQAPSFDVWSSTHGHSMHTADAAGAHVPTLTGQGAIVGTPFYMAPEQLRGEAIDARADQFAWGVVAFSLLTGAPPWSVGQEPLALLSQILSLVPPEASSIDPAIPSSISRTIARSLAKRREDRFASMTDVVSALEGATVDVAPSPTSRATPSSSSAMRGAVGTVAAVAVLAAALFGARRASRPHVAEIAQASVATGGATGGASAGATVECTSASQCVRADGKARHCHSARHVCVEVDSIDCKAYAAPHAAERDDVVWIGGLFPLSTDPDLISEMRAADLARDDFAKALGASADRPGALHARPIALAICDEGVDGARAARHLVEDLEVPAILGFRSTPNALATIATELLPHQVLSVVTISQAPEVTRIPEPPGDPRLVWRTTLDRDATVRPIARFIADVLEPDARKGRLGARPLKVAAVLAKSANHDFIESLFGALRFNGLSALENGTNFRQLVIDDDSAEQDDAVIDALALFAPQVIVYSTETFAIRVMPRLEARWGKEPRPAYVTGSGLSPSLFSFASTDATRRRRFFALTNVSTTMTNAELVLRYNAAYPQEPVARTDAPQPSYDAFYMLAYATYSLGDGPITGPGLSRAFDRLLPPGPRRDVGPRAIFDTFSTLRAGGRVDLEGAIGSLDFDRATGEAPIDYAVVCLGVDDRGAASAPIDSGLVYDARLDKLVGSMRCP